MLASRSGIVIEVAGEPTGAVRIFLFLVWIAARGLVECDFFVVDRKSSHSSREQTYTIAILCSINRSLCIGGKDDIGNPVGESDPEK